VGYQLKFSALSEWAEFFGIRRIPEWLRDEHADSVAQIWAKKVIATSLLAAVVGAVIWYSTRPPQIIRNPIPVLGLRCPCDVSQNVFRAG
jgi:hypothetical protein